MLLYSYVARTDTHSFISNVFIYRFFFKKKNPAWHKDLSNYLKTAATEDKLGLEASSAEVLWGAQKTISASTSWEAEDDGVHLPLRCEIKQSQGEGTEKRKWSKARVPLTHLNS